MFHYKTSLRISGTVVGIMKYIIFSDVNHNSNLEKKNDYRSLNNFIMEMLNEP